MNSINTNPALDTKTLIAIVTANPEGMAIIGAWNGMETMAREDPEGCVRLSPCLPMDNTALAAFFHCPVAIVEKTVEVFEKLGRLTVKDGLIKIMGCGEVKPALTEEALARKREQDRIRQAEYRARRKQAQKAGTGRQPAAETRVTPVTTRDRNRDNCDTTCNPCDALCTGTTTSNSKNKDIEDIKDIKNKKDDEDIFSFSAKETSELDALLSCDPHTLIPLDKLPLPLREIPEAWNRLPLKKLDGLYPAMLHKLLGLLGRYTPESLLEAIGNIGESPFLLGRSENSTGFVISFKWFLSVPHLENILAGKYKALDRSRFLQNMRRHNRYIGNQTAEPEEDGVSLEEMSPAERCLAISRLHNNRIAGVA